MFITIATTPEEVLIAKKHSEHLPNITVITNHNIADLNTIRPPFYNTKIKEDIFWRMIYASDLPDLYYVSSELTDELNYDFILQTAKLETNVFIRDNSLLYKFGHQLSCNAFKIRRDKHGYTMFKIFEHAYRNLAEFNESVVYAPNRNVMPHGLTQYVFSHIPLDHDAAIFEKENFLICRT